MTDDVKDRFLFFRRALVTAVLSDAANIPEGESFTI